MQQRRGSEAQWDDANTVLASGEIGVNTDTGQFKLGDGFSTWLQLEYFQNFTQLGETYATISDLEAVIGLAPETLDTLEELADAINNDPDFFNTIQAERDAKVDKTGDIMTGDLTLPNDPTQELHAATKQYVDQAETDANTFTTTALSELELDDISDVNTTGVTDGEALVYDVATDKWIPGVLTSSLDALEDTNLDGVVDGNALVYDVATDKWIPGEGGGKFTVSDTAPEGPEGGDTWFDSTTGKSYIYYEDVDTDQWVEIGAQPTGFLGLNELNDVDTTGLLSGNALVYDAEQGKWVPGEGSGGGSFTISDTAPEEPEAGDVWFNSSTGKTYIYYTDTDTDQWVEIASQTTGFGVLDELNDVDTGIPTGGEFLRYNESASKWQTDNYTDPVKLNRQIITENFSIPSGSNGLSAGPITIAEGVTVTVPVGSAWSIV